jgi:hypothetical protein
MHLEAQILYALIENSYHFARAMQHNLLPVPGQNSLYYKGVKNININR